MLAKVDGNGKIKLWFEGKEVKALNVVCQLLNEIKAAAPSGQEAYDKACTALGSLTALCELDE